MHHSHGFVFGNGRIQRLSIKQITLYEGTELHRTGPASDETVKSHWHIALPRQQFAGMGADVARATPVTKTCFIICPLKIGLCHRLVLDGPELVRPDGYASLATHYVEQDPDTTVWLDLLDLGHEIGERTVGHGHLVARVQKHGGH